MRNFAFIFARGGSKGLPGKILNHWQENRYYNIQLIPL